MASDANGGAFYDAAERVDRYLKHRHDAGRSPNVTMEEPAFLASVGDVRDVDVLDLGCGDGNFGSIAIDAGCRSYRGIDRSAAMVERAQRRLAGTHAVIEQAAIEDVQLPLGSVDLVVSRLALHYVSDLDAALRNVHGSLRPGGRAVISVVHPVVTSHDIGDAGPRQHWVVDDYFVPGPRRRTWFDEAVVWHHRTIEQYVNALRTSGLSLLALSECEPVASLFAADHVELARRRRVPLFLLLNAQRLDTPR